MTTPQQTSQLQQLFNLIDADKKGYLDSASITNALPILNLIVDSATYQQYEQWAQNPTCHITFPQFAEATPALAPNFPFNPIPVAPGALGGLPSLGSMFTKRDSLFVGLTAHPQPTASYPEITSPVVLIPGLSGSALQNDGDRVWINIMSMFKIWPEKEPRYIKNLTCVWNEATQHLSSLLPVQPYPGLSGVNDLDGHSCFFNGFAPLTKVLNPHNKDNWVDAAPYDWRLVPQKDTMSAWILGLKDTITRLFKANNKKVFLLAHSLGNLMTVYFFWNLSQNDPDFAGKYIAGFLSTSPPYAGAGLGVQAVVAGMKEPLDITVPASLLQNFACFGWVFPWADPKQPGPVLIYNGTPIMADGFPEFLQSFAPVSSEIFVNTVAPIKNEMMLKKPPVPMYLFTSVDAPTCIGIDYENGALKQQLLEKVPAGKPDQMGDGTVPYDSLHAMDTAWGLTPIVIGSHTNPVSHGDIISNDQYYSQVISVINTGHPLTN